MSIVGIVLQLRGVDSATGPAQQRTPSLQQHHYIRSDWPAICVAGNGITDGPSSTEPVDAFHGELRAAVRSLEDAVTDERVFLRPSAHVSAVARAAAKALFDHTGSLSAAAAAGELYVEGFDAEQIWGQLELQVGVSCAANGASGSCK